MTLKDITAAAFNEEIIKDRDNGTLDTNEISDGYHTMGELYQHRIALWIALCKVYHAEGYGKPWRSQTHADNSVWEGWFILGLKVGYVGDMTYHLPISDWDRCAFAETLDRAPEWDGHTSVDVLERIKNL